MRVPKWLVVLIIAWGVVALTWAIAGAVLSRRTLTTTALAALRWSGAVVIGSAGFTFAFLALRDLARPDPQLYLDVLGLLAVVPAVAWWSLRPRLAGVTLWLLAIATLPTWYGAVSCVVFGGLGYAALYMARGIPRRNAPARADQTGEASAVV